MKYLITLIIVLAPITALAHPHRCYGRVYQQPCHMVEPPMVNKVMTEPKASMRLPKFKLQDQSFRELNSRTGHWRGYISGVGKVKLLLKFFSRRKKTIYKYIGTLDLASDNSPVLFSYKTSLPTNRPWSWKVVAIPILN